MSILSDFEERVGRTVEGGFARVFRAPVQPAELARRLGREMDKSKVVGIGKIYAPTMFSIILSPEDDARIGGFAATLAGELETYLVAYAREHAYSLAARPFVRFLVDPDLKLGRFEVIGELLSPEEMEREIGKSREAQQQDLAEGVAAAAIPGAAPVGAGAVVPPAAAPHYTTAFPEPAVPERSVRAAAGPHPRPARVTVAQLGDFALAGQRVILGRLSSCDITIPDHNVSREHAAFVREGDGWALEDLGSTNGTYVNGAEIQSMRLREGDRIRVGVTEMVFHEAVIEEAGR